MNLRDLACAALLGAALLACSSSNDSAGSSSTTGAGGGSSDATTTSATTTSGSGGAGGATGTGGAGGAAAPEPQAPIMKMVMKMDGALHASWTNVSTDCDKILLFRNENGGDYALAYTLSGVATNKHDTQASNSAVTYCYRAECKMGDVTSADSNEKCNTP